MGGAADTLATVGVDGVRVVMCHYGLRVWPGMRRKAIALCGHSHGRLPGTSMSLDAGVDCKGFAPVAWTASAADCGPCLSIPTRGRSRRLAGGEA